MRYLKVFGVPVFVCICITITTIAVKFEKNSEETLNITPSNTISDTLDKTSEGIINVETSSNDGVLVQTVYAATTEESVIEETPAPTPEATPEPTVEPEIKEEHDAKTDSNNYADGIVKTVPKGKGSKHTFMGWQLVTNKSSKQYKLRKQSGENYDSNGFAKVGDRYVVATKPYYGKIGDYIDVYKSNGEVIKCIIGDAKGSDGGGDKYSHADGSIVEFVVDKYKWYSKHNGLGRYRTVGEFHPSWGKHSISKIVNIGNYWA